MARDICLTRYGLRKGDMDIRDEILTANKRHRSSWLKLGKLLFEVTRENKFEEWGFESFDEYLKQELGITKTVARDMITAYEYIKQNEPSLLNTIETEDSDGSTFIPNYRTICQLRKAHDNDKIDGDDAESFHKKLFNEGAEKEVANDIKEKSKEELNPMDEIRKEAKAVKSLAKRLDNKLHETSAFGMDIIESFESINNRIQQVEV